MTQTIELIYFNAGGGHRAAALALDAVLRERGGGLEVRCTNVMDVLDPTGRFKRITGMAPEDYYNKRLATGFTLGLAQELKVFQGAIRFGHAKLVRQLEQHWLRGEPDLVVSLIPNLNRPLCASLASALPGVPFLTVMTDLADYSPDFWIVPDQPQWLVCATDRAQEQALALGCEPSRVHRVSGMILRPDFYGQPEPTRDTRMLALGLDPERPTGLVLFGGHGSRAMVKIAQELAGVQLILLCGHNAALAAKLRATPSRAPRAVVGFTSDVQRYMRLADFFIGKPGPGSLSEAVHCGLPVVTVRNGWTLPQERYNTQWVTDHGLGVVGTSFGRLREPVQYLLAHLNDHRVRVRAMPPNRAVFEVADLIKRMVESPALSGPHPLARLAASHFPAPLTRL
jgi:UDP-N-acetylglucosamine:LPS N-acetylglucosamine transferase